MSSSGWAVRPWTTDRLDDLAVLARAALPDEELHVEDLAWCCFDDPPRDPADGRVGPTRTVGVDGPDGPVGALSFALRRLSGLTVAHAQLLAVPVEMRRRGVATSLVSHAELLAREAGADTLQLGGAAPFSLFTGVDSRWTDALCLAERTGFDIAGVELDLVASTEAPSAGRHVGTSTGWVEADCDADGPAEAFLARHHPHWLAELRRGVRRGRVLAAREGSEVVGLAAHSVNRAGVVGPVVVHPDHRGGGIGTELMIEVLADLRARGFERAEIAWTSTVRFYALACGARVLRSSLSCAKRLGRER